MEKKHFWKLWLPCFLVFVVMIIVIIIVWFRCCCPVTTVLLVRHAEKAMQPIDDPNLTDAGHARAQTLAHVTGEAGVEAIYASEALRTKQTVEPSRSQLGLVLSPINSSNVNVLVEDILSNHAGGVVLVAGHSPTVPQILAALSGETFDTVEEYDNLFVVTVCRLGRAKVMNLKYGDPG